MTVALYMDHHVPRAITSGLRLHGVDIVTAHEDGCHELDDSALLDRANELKRVLFTQDDDLLAEAKKRQTEGISFHGVIYAHQLKVTIGRCISDLKLISTVGEKEDILNKVEFLPLA
jgi:uncharacterized protein with PIN domain